MSHGSRLLRRTLITARLATSTVLAVLLSFALLRTSLLGQQGSTDALPFAKSYLLTGNYVVGGIDLQPDPRSGGFVSGNIPISGVPANADILAAFLYWETFSTPGAHIVGAKFRDQPIEVVKKTYATLDSSTAACAAVPNAGGGTLTMWRADVLRLLPLQKDSKGNVTSKRVVNDADLTASGLAGHTVSLPQNPNAPGILQNSGASLLLVYRDPLQPLTS